MRPHELPVFEPREIQPIDAFLAERETGRVVHRADGDLVVFTYGKTAMFEGFHEGWDPVVRNARGIVFRASTGELLSLTFEKFFNVGENEGLLPDNLPDGPFRATEKLDGSMVGVFHDGERWRAHTKGSLDGPYVEWAEVQIGKQLDEERLDALRGLTLVFEGVYPRGQFEYENVVDYGDREEMVLTAAFDVGRRAEVRPEGVDEIASYLGVARAPSLEFESLDEVLARVPELGYDEEGFVVQYLDTGLRVKVKGERYVRAHKALAFATPLAFWESLGPDGRVSAEMLDLLPERVRDDVEPIRVRLETEYRKLRERTEELAQAASAEPEGRDRGIWVSEHAGALKGAVFAALKENGPVVHKCIAGLLRPDGNEWTDRASRAMEATSGIEGVSRPQVPAGLASLEGLRATFGAESIDICLELQRAGHDAVIVGGPVRDALRGESPHDVDLATSAEPDQVRALFPRTFVQGKGDVHGTIGVLGEEDEVYEVTTYRLDVETDGRHAEVRFTEDLTEDLKRRDFTMNAVALRPRENGPTELMDPFGGQADLAEGRIRAVGQAHERFEEDYLRVLRAYRFAGRFEFDIEEETRAAVRKAVPGLANISRERIRDELMKLGSQSRDRDAVLKVLLAMQADGVFAQVLPELEATVGVTQNEHHAYDVWRHSAGAAAEAASRSDDPRLFLAALLHDVGKPETRSVGDDGRVHFYRHEEAGARTVHGILGRFALSRKERGWITEAVAQHMRLMTVERTILEGTDTSGRRAIGRILRDLKYVGLEDLLTLRIADKSASGVDGAKLPAEFVARVHELLEQIRAEGRAFTRNDLAVNGGDLMRETGEKPGRWIGDALEVLLSDVIEERVANEREALLSAFRSRRRCPTRR